jgi:hypothetical protein
MNVPAGLQGIGILSGAALSIIIILAAICLLHLVQVKRLSRNGLLPFSTCNGREKWGTRDLVLRWRSQAMYHLASELSVVQHSIWQIKHRIENLREMEMQVRNKREELNLSLILAKERRAKDSVLFIRFEIVESEAKIRDIIGRITRNEQKLRSLRRIMNRKKACIERYKKGKNPSLSFIKRIKGFFFFQE